MTFASVVGAELLKLRRCRVTGLSLLAFALGPLGCALFLWIVQRPERAAELGLIGAKAEMLALEASWAGYFEMLTQMVGIVGGLLTAVIATYVFGREYVEGTAKNMLALPVPRTSFVLAKFVVAAGWWFALVMAILAEALAVAVALRLPGFSVVLLGTGVRDILLVASVGFLLTPVVAWIAIMGRGYLPPLGFAMLALVLGNVLGATGWGKWFPWSIVPLFAGVAGPRVEMLAPGSLAVVGLTCVAGLAATVAQVRWGDVPS